MNPVGQLSAAALVALGRETSPGTAVAGAVLKERSTVHDWIGVVLGLIGVCMATLGDLCESVIKRDLGIKDMSQVVPGHGGLMDRLDSLLATIAPTWLLLHYLVFT